MQNLTITVRSLSRRPTWATHAAGLVLVALAAGLVPGDTASAQVPKRHWLHAGVMPPGAIGSQRLLRNGPLSACDAAWVQPVEVQTPPGVAVAAVSGGGFSTAYAGSLKVGLKLAAVYRFRVDGVLNDQRVEVYPTVELIGRLYPPPGKAARFPIPVQLTAEELRMAAAGSFVTRVIYVEDPTQALPVAEAMVDGRREQQYFEARPDQDPLLVADMLGRPVAILRIGSRLPGGPLGYGDPPIRLYGEESRGAFVRPEIGSVTQQNVDGARADATERSPVDRVLPY
ncbi:MAG: hypothetical protein AAF790_05295 [Planctomycetota bacterium]